MDYAYSQSRHLVCVLSIHLYSEWDDKNIDKDANFVQEKMDACIKNEP